MLRALVFAAVAAFSVAPASASSTPASRATCTTTGDDIAQTWTNAAHALNAGPNPALGQSLTSPCDGQLRSISLTVAELSTPGALSLALHQGAGDGGVVVATGTVNVTAVGVYTVVFQQPVAVTTGAVYTFKLTVPAGAATSAALATWYGGGNGLRYPGGVEYVTTGTGPFTSLSQFDLTFGADFGPVAPAGCAVSQLASNAAIDLIEQGNPALGQSFTTPCGGRVQAVGFRVSVVNQAGPLALTLYAGAGDGGAVLATGTVIVQVAGAQTVTLAQPVTVTANGVYTFKLTVPAGASTYVDLEEHTVNPYAGGAEYNVAYAGGGTVFAPDGSADLAFSVEVEAGVVAAEQAALPTGGLALGPAAPNPAAERATVPLTVATTGPVGVGVYDLLGRPVALVYDGVLAAGRHRLPIRTEALPEGVYVVRATAGPATAVQRITVLR